MTPLLLAAVLFIAAIGLVAAELILPTGGALGVLGGLAILGAIGACFWVNAWLGAAALMATLASIPLLGKWLIAVWPRSRLGRRFVLQPIAPVPSVEPVRIGQTGVAFSEMRPSGEVDFGDLRLEAKSDLGMIAAGQLVRVVGFAEGRPRVRAVLPGDTMPSAAPDPGER
jgi:membrane-bound serine protease (ClpP class)